MWHGGLDAGGRTRFNSAATAYPMPTSGARPMCIISRVSRRQGWFPRATAGILRAFLSYCRETMRVRADSDASAADTVVRAFGIPQGDSALFVAQLSIGIGGRCAIVRV